MDPLAHTAVGACLAELGLKRKSALATATLVVGANLPDVDAFAGLWGKEASMLFRRGWTHGVLALVVLPLLLAGLVLLYDQRVRRRRDPSLPSARPGVIVALSYLGVLTHPFLDWLNTYGIRLLMPFDGTWFYGDALFIVDPVLWFTMGAVLVLAHGQRAPGLAAWALLLAAMSALVTLSDRPPTVTKVLWCLALGALVVVRLALRPRARLETWARVGFAAGTLYVAGMILASRVAGEQARAFAASFGQPILGQMVAPAPGDPLRRTVLLELEHEYQVYELDWLEDGGPRPLRPPIAKRTDEGAGERFAAIVEAARGTPSARARVIRSRFPIYAVTTRADCWRVGLGDARRAARGGALEDHVVWLDQALQPTDAARCERGD